MISLALQKRMSKVAKTVFVVLGNNIRGSRDIINTPLIENIQSDVSMKIINNVDVGDITTDERIPQSFRAKMSWFPFVGVITDNKAYYYHPEQNQDAQSLLEWIDDPKQYRHYEHPKKYGLTHRQIRHNYSMWDVYTVRDIEMNNV